MAEHDYVIFADAAVRGAEPFSVQAVIAGRWRVSFTHPQRRAGRRAGLATRCSARRHARAMSGIRGYEFNEFGERLSEKARRKLGRAVRFIESS